MKGIFEYTESCPKSGSRRTAQGVRAQGARAPATEPETLPRLLLPFLCFQTLGKEPSGGSVPNAHKMVLFPHKIEMISPSSLLVVLPE